MRRKTDEGTHAHHSGARFIAWSEKRETPTAADAGPAEKTLTVKGSTAMAMIRNIARARDGINLRIMEISLKSNEALPQKGNLDGRS
jgi:hypothetical protein